VSRPSRRSGRAMDVGGDRRRRFVSAPEDKSKIVFHAAMMAIQNFGFFIMYWDIYKMTPATTADDICDGTRWITGFMAFTCFAVSWLCVGMGYGGYTSDKVLFPLYWILHLAGGLCYCYCTVAIPLEIYSDDGKACTKVSPTGPTVEAVWILHAALFLGYVINMLSITFFSFLKPSFFSKSKLIKSKLSKVANEES